MYLHDESGKNRPCCGVSAVATVTGRKLDVVFDYFKDKFNKTENWKGSTIRHEVREVLKDYKVSTIQIGQEFKRRDSKVGRQFKGFAKKHLVQNRTYMIWTTRHVQVYHNGMVFDQNGVVPMDKYWGKNKYVNLVLEVF
jgi:hypothetical protein